MRRRSMLLIDSGALAISIEAEKVHSVVNNEFARAKIFIWTLKSLNHCYSSRANGAISCLARSISSQRLDYLFGR